MLKVKVGGFWDLPKVLNQLNSEKMMKFSHNLLVIKINQNLNGHSTRIGANIIMHHAVSNFSFEIKNIKKLYLQAFFLEKDSHLWFQSSLFSESNFTFTHLRGLYFIRGEN